MNTNILIVDDEKDITGIYYEPWHFRYVGLPHSSVITAKAFCLEEYIDYIYNYEFSKKHLIIRSGSNRYEIYYIRGTKVAVPKSKEYSISGNNIDGFIVTVQKS